MVASVATDAASKLGDSDSEGALRSEGVAQWSVQVQVTAEQDQRVSDGSFERTLLEKVAGGDQTAFEQLFLRYQAQVYGVVLAVLRDQTQAQEVTQEVFLQLWQQASRFDATLSSTATWIKRLARTAPSTGSGCVKVPAPGTPDIPRRARQWITTV